MVTSEDSTSYLVVYHLIDDTLRDEDVVQSPANVLCARIRHVSPEGVGALLSRIKVSICVDKLRFSQEFRHPIPFLLGEASVPLVRLRIGQV